MLSRPGMKWDGRIPVEPAAIAEVYDFYTSHAKHDLEALVNDQFQVLVVDLFDLTTDPPDLDLSAFISAQASMPVDGVQGEARVNIGGGFSMSARATATTCSSTLSSIPLLRQRSTFEP
jgi:hypothetical protein